MLGDIARVKDDFQDVDKMATFDNKRAIGIEVYRIGDQTPIGVSEAAREAMQTIQNQLPPGVDWTITRDSADVYRQRLALLLTNAGWGLLLVILLLGAFLEIQAGIVGDDGNSGFISGSLFIFACDGCDDQYDLDVCIHHCAGHRRG